MSVYPQSVPTLPEGVPAGPPSGTVPAAAAGGEPHRFRGRTLEELLPQIRAALGPDAVVLRRREGLQGGALGFFQTRFVEVEAVAGAPDGSPVDGGGAVAGTFVGGPSGAAGAVPADGALRFDGTAGVVPAPRFDAYDADDAWPEDVSDDGVRWRDEGPAASTPPAPAPRTTPAGPPTAAPLATGGADGGAARDVAAESVAPIDGAAFLRHLDAAVERRRAEDRATERDPGARPAGLLDRLVATQDATPERPDPRDAAPADRPFAGLARTVAPWTPARADAGRPAPAASAPVLGGAATATLTAPGSGEVRAVAGPASVRLELRDDEPLAKSAAGRRALRDDEPLATSPTGRRDLGDDR